MEYYGQCHADKLGNLDKMGKSLEWHKLLKLSQEERKT